MGFQRLMRLHLLISIKIRGVYKVYIVIDRSYIGQLCDLISETLFFQFVGI